MELQPTTIENQKVPDEDVKNILAEKIKKMLTIDNQLKALKQEKQVLEIQKKELSKELIQIMKTNEYTTLSTKTDTLQYKVTKTKVLGKKQLESLLHEYFKGDVVQADNIKNFIFEHLKERVVEQIVRKGNGNNASVES